MQMAGAEMFLPASGMGNTLPVGMVRQVDIPKIEDGKTDWRCGTTPFPKQKAVTSEDVTA